MDALRVIADDLTGACDVGAELLPWPGGVVVQPLYSGVAPVGAGAEALCVRNTQSRTLPPAEAAGRVAGALADVGSGWSGVVLKKIDTGLRGPLGAEIDAAMDALHVDEAFVLPAIPEVGRTTEGGRQMIAGVPVDQTAFARDPHNPIGEAYVPAAIAATGRRRAASVELATVRDPAGFRAEVEAARAAGASVLVCDAETDADIERAVRALLQRARPLLLVGSTGLARALRRVLGPEQSARPRPGAPASLPTTGVLVVMGSAHPTAHAQVERAAARGLLEPIVVGDGGASPQEAGLVAGRCVQAGRAAALVPPLAPLGGGSERVLAGLRSAALAALARVRPSGLALIGGETAFQVLDGLGYPPLALEMRLSPLVVRSRLTAGPYGGMPLVTKGGSSGAQDLLGAIVRQLGGRPLMQVAEGRVVTLEYTVRVADGTLIDSTGSCGPVAVLQGAGQLFPALESRLDGLSAGDTREFRIPPDEGYGARNPDLLRSLPRDRLPPELTFEAGKDYRIKAKEGRTLRFRVVAVTPTEVQADFNSPYAGQDLVATVTIVAVRAATPDEERRGRVG